MNKRATYAASFDPITNGHLWMVKESIQGYRNVSVAIYENQFLVDFAKSLNIKFLVREIRSETDYEYERTIRYVNSDLDSNILSLFLIPPREFAEVSSSIVKSLIEPQGWREVTRKYVPQPVYAKFLQMYG